MYIRRLHSGAEDIEIKGFEAVIAKDLGSQKLPESRVPSDRRWNHLIIGEIHRLMGANVKSGPARAILSLACVSKSGHLLSLKAFIIH